MIVLTILLVIIAFALGWLASHMAYSSVLAKKIREGKVLWARGTENGVIAEFMQIEDLCHYLNGDALWEEEE